MRRLILAAAPGIAEERKWRKPSNGMAGVPVWSLSGIVCTGETYKDTVKLTFAKGAGLPDPAGLFSAGRGGTRRAIDIHEGETVDAAAFKALVNAAISANRRTRSGPPRLLAGGNPQIARGDGDGPVQEFIAAMPGWTRGAGQRLDAIIERAVPGVRKAVKWNSPFYGVAGRGWFLSFHVFTRYVKTGFFRGASLRPPPPGESKQKEVRYLNLHERDTLDEALFTRWVRQAAALPGWLM
ncbi:MAG: DUF1801 domain-containing protein [Phycisphaerales bacterium]|nr:DUF1801 domain-containing protein [Phycisphaerales bacterium]